MSAASAIQPWSAPGTAAIASSKDEVRAVARPAQRRVDGDLDRRGAVVEPQAAAVGGDPPAVRRRGQSASKGPFSGIAGAGSKTNGRTARRRGRQGGAAWSIRGGGRASTACTQALNRDSLLHRTRCPTAPPSAPRRKRAATRERVVDAARELIAHGGYREAQVAAVAARAGVATGTVYRHFPSKADLFAEVFRSVSQREVDAARAAADAAPAEHGDRAARGRHRDVRPPRPARPPPGLGAARRAGRPGGRGRAPRLPPRPRRALRRDPHAPGSRAASFPTRTRTSSAPRSSARSARRSSARSRPSPRRRDPDALVAKLVAFCLRSVTDHQDAHADARP